MTSREQTVLKNAVLALRGTTSVRARVRRDRRAESVVEIQNGRGTNRYRPQVKTVDRFETPAIVQSRRKEFREPLLLVAPYITREVGEECRQLQLPFIDTAGNAYLEAPGMLVYVTGQPRRTEAPQKRFRSLNAAGLQIAFAVLSTPGLIHSNYRRLAAEAGVALGSVGPVMKDLESRGLLRLRNRRERKLLDGERLVEEWVTHYPIALRPKLNPRRFLADPERLRQLDLAPHRAFWGAEPAAERLTRYLKPAQFTIYTRGPAAKLIAAGRMRAAEEGNVEILDAFWNFAVETVSPDVVPPLLAYADLLATHDGRNIEAARIIYEQRIAPAFHTLQSAG